MYFRPNWLVAALIALATSANGFAGDAPVLPARGGSLIRARINVQRGMEGWVGSDPVILDTKTASFAFGRTISRQTLAVQVPINNISAEHDLLIHEISLMVCNADESAGGAATDPDLPCPKGTLIRMSSLNRTVLQGTADRGQSRDPRNMALRIITGLAAFATPLPGVVSHLGHSFIPSVAAIGGPGVEAYKGIFPDYTVNQIIRLSNIAFDRNKLVPKQNSVDVVIFVPLEMLLSKAQIAQFRKDPHDFFIHATRNYRVLVEAQYIVPVPPQ